MNSELTETDVVAWLSKQPDKVFVQAFYKAAAGRRLMPLDDAEYDSHLVIAHAAKNSEAPGDWEIEFIGIPENTDEWIDDAVICQQGEHCFQTVLSFAKEFRCPLCGGEAYGT